MKLDEAQVSLAVRALLKHLKVTKSSSDLLDEENVISLQIGFKQTPDRQRTAKQIPLPHSLHAPGTTAICLITKDTQEEFEELLKEKEVPGDITVLGISKLRNEYKPFEAKRQLCQMYDLFLADDRVVPLLPKLLGKKFYETKKKPTKVDLRRKNLAAEIAKARDSTALFLGQGPCSAVKVGHSAFTAEQLVENIMAVADKTQTYVRKNGIQAMHIKTSASVALPIYNDLPTFEDLQPHEMTTRKAFYTTEDHKKKQAEKKLKRKRDPLGDDDEETEAAAKGSGKGAKAVEGDGNGAATAKKGAKGAKAKKGKKAAVKAEPEKAPNKKKKQKTKAAAVVAVAVAAPAEPAKKVKKSAKKSKKKKGAAAK